MDACNTGQSLILRNYDNLRLEYRQDNSLWSFMHAHPRPCFTPALLQDFIRMQDDIVEIVHSGDCPADYLVIASDVPGVFNLGGDLALFRHLIEHRDRDGLFRYARRCIDVLYRNFRSLELPLTVISLVQGSALGGGFEAALSSSVIVAERSAEMGFPEILFNLFPGMGAWSLLSRKVGSGIAGRLITSGRRYKAEELHELGVVDVLAGDGEGALAVSRFIRHHRRHGNGFRAIERVRRYCEAIGYQELMHIVEEWVDAALMLAPRDLRMMDRLVGMQNRKRGMHVSSAPPAESQVQEPAASFSLSCSISA